MTEQRSKQAEVGRSTGGRGLLRAQCAEMEAGSREALNHFWTRAAAARERTRRNWHPLPQKHLPAKPFSLRFKLSNMSDGTPLAERALSWSLPVSRGVPRLSQFQVPLNDHPKGRSWRKRVSTCSPGDVGQCYFHWFSQRTNCKYRLLGEAI